MQRPQALFFTAIFLSRLADQILLFLVPLVVFQTTQSAAWTGLAFFAESLPRFAAYPVCGALCDRISPLRLLHTSQAARAVCCVTGTFACAMSGGIGWLVGLSAIAGALTTQGTMAREVMLPHLFAATRYETVLAHAQIAEQTGMVLGPMVAAVLLGVITWQWVIGVCALLFAIADCSTLRWQRTGLANTAIPRCNAASLSTGLAPYRTALQQVLGLPGLLPLVVLTSGVNLVIGGTQATAAAVVTGTLKQSANQFALLQTAGAVSTVVVLFFVARVHMPLRTMGALSYACILGGAVAMANSTGVAAYTLGYLAVCGFDKMFSVTIRSTRQKLIPAGDFGKTTGLVVMLNNLSQPLAGLAVGALSPSVSAQDVIALLAFAMVVWGLVALALQRARR